MNQPKLKVGKRYCQCSACGEYFTSPNPFDLHREGLHKGERGCKSPDTMQRLGFYKKDGYWTVPMGYKLPKREKDHEPAS